MFWRLESGPFFWESKFLVSNLVGIKNTLDFQKKFDLNFENFFMIFYQMKPHENQMKPMTQGQRGYNDFYVKSRYPNWD